MYMHTIDICLKLCSETVVRWVAQGLTSHRTHYRSFQRRVFCKGFPSLKTVMLNTNNKHVHI